MQVGTNRTIGYIVVSFLWLCFTSCAGIFRTTYYITETQGWKKADYNGVNDIAYTNDTTPDSIMLNVEDQVQQLQQGQYSFPLLFPHAYCFG